MSKNVCEFACPFPISKLRKMEFLKRHFSSGTMTWRSIYGERSIAFQLCFESGRPYMRLSYKAAGEPMEYDVELVTTPCNYGGVRYWFICPASRSGIPCRRRIGVLYSAGPYFACRRCHDLAYQSQQEKRSHVFGIYGLFLNRSDQLDAMERKIRVKFWKGHPTKRYAKFLKKIGGLNNRFAHPIFSGEARRELEEKLK